MEKSHKKAIGKVLMKVWKRENLVYVVEVVNG